MDINSKWDKLDLIEAKQNEVQARFHKELLVIGSSLLGILVALHKTSLYKYSNMWVAYTMAIALLSLGILLLCISLYSQVYFQNKLYLQEKERICKSLAGLIFEPSSLDLAKKIYTFLEFSSYISLILSVISLTIYAILVA